MTTLESFLDATSSIIGQCRSSYETNVGSNAVSFEMATSTSILAICLSVSLARYVLRSTSTSKKTHTTTKAPNQQQGEVKDIFTAMGRSSSSSKKTTKTREGGLPFGSSYYYAHNNPESKGGYKDGLKTEDYVMNQPRLLSVNGITVPDKRNLSKKLDDNTTKDGTPTELPKQTDNQAISQEEEQQQQITIIPINKYLWDDSGETTTATTTKNRQKQYVAKIYIDTLPHAKYPTTRTISWQEASISKSNVSATINNNGQTLSVDITTDSSCCCRYRLYVEKTYGQIESVQTIVKSKRLIVKLIKKQTKKSGLLSSTFSFNNNNDDDNDAIWPQLSAKKKKEMNHTNFMNDDLLEEAEMMKQMSGM